MENLDKVYAQRIAEEYSDKKETKVVRLKKLDENVKKPALIFAYLFGAFSALIVGVGMSMILTDFGPSGTIGWIVGIAIGVIGLILCAVDYPIYLKILKSRRQKYAFEITELAKDIVENN